MDPRRSERAARETPFGTTIAHGFLTLSLVSSLLKDAVLVSGVRMSINYGLNRVRFVSPVPSGSRIRAQVSLGALSDVDGGVQATWNVTVEREGGEKPCLVAEWLVRYTSDAVSDTREVRDTERLDWAALESWLRERLPDAGVPGLDVTQPMRVEQFPGGHSNLTYLVRFGDVDLVMRRPPLGPVPPTAHDMAREFRWLSAVHPVYPLAPRTYLLCDDPAIVGSVFYVMERRTGVVIRRDEPPAVDGHPEVRRQISGAVIDALADLHRVDLAATDSRTSGNRSASSDGRSAGGASAGSARRPTSCPRWTRCPRGLPIICRQSPNVRRSCTATSSSTT